jgi:hypothetical protein
MLYRSRASSCIESRMSVGRLGRMECILFLESCAPFLPLPRSLFTAIASWWSSLWSSGVVKRASSYVDDHPSVSKWCKSTRRSSSSSESSSREDDCRVLSFGRGEGIGGAETGLNGRFALGPMARFEMHLVWRPSAGVEGVCGCCPGLVMSKHKVLDGYLRASSSGGMN